MSVSEVEVVARKRLPLIWLVPIAAVVVGAWLVYFSATNRGPMITIHFSTAEGIVAGETRIKARSVDVGLVEAVSLDESLDGVRVSARLEPDTQRLLRTDSRFWVVRPRIGFGGVSGLGTLLSGGYIELAPGDGAMGRRDFDGFDEPPVTAPGVPGLRLTLVSEDAGSVHTGNPILYHGFPVGRIESAEFDLEAREMRYGAFIDAPYDRLVGVNTRFWNASGVTVSASVSGFELSTGSLETLATGGVSLGDPLDGDHGEAVASGAIFTLHPDAQRAQNDPYRFSDTYVVEFDQSVRGLEPGAPVELRGLTVGRVQRVLLEEIEGDAFGDAALPIPVVIELEPGHLRLPDDASGIEALREVMRDAVDKGLFASLQTGNLLTGQLYVALDFDSSIPPGAVGRLGGYPTLPSRSTGLAQLERKLGDVLDKLAALPLDRLVEDSGGAVEAMTAALQSAERTLVQLERTLSDDALQALPEELGATLDALRAAVDSVSEGSPLYRRVDRSLSRLDRSLDNVQGLTRSLEEQPSSLLRRIPRTPDPLPGGRDR
ncbi:MAG: intermembrane transport protein PqiB [Pseudomonadales bacterium]|jgi:paraquat-inducible protein B|nr:intermembrane transport protein PqiB [Pseudomonadales bacterium]